MNLGMELNPFPTLDDLLPVFSHWPGLVVFDSAKQSHPLGRYSYLSADPIRTFEIANAEYGLDPFTEIREALTGFSSGAIPELPPFQGGAAGILSYELGRCFEQLPDVPHDELKIPHLAVGVYDWVIAWDHQQNRCWIVSTGYPETDPRSQRVLARERAFRVLRAIADKPTAPPFQRSPRCALTSKSFSAGELPQLGSNFSHETYLAAVERVIEYIRAGDIFQANLAQRLIYPSNEAPLELYGGCGGVTRLRSRGSSREMIGPLPVPRPSDFCSSSTESQRLGRLKERDDDTRTHRPICWSPRNCMKVKRIWLRTA